MSRTAQYEIVSGDLAYKKECERFVPLIMTEEPKQKQMGTLLSWFDKDGVEFLNHSIYHRDPDLS